MINIILIILILSTIYNIKFNKDIYPVILNCGIWGYYGKKGTPGFDWMKFDWIGASNDHRGGDACGRVAGSKFSHNISNNTKKYSDFILNGKLPPEIDNKVKAVFGHSRKASLSAGFEFKELQYTQPLLFINDDLKLDFIGSHNGTLYNHKELAKKYGIDNILYKYLDDDKKIREYQMNDSQILLYIVGKLKKFEVLSEYNGAAAFAIYNYDSNELMLWNGASKLGEYSKHKTLERELYYIQHEDHLWFSSEIDPLIYTNYDENLEAEMVPENQLMIFKDGVLKESKSIERKSIQQKITYTNNKIKIFNNNNKDKSKNKSGKQLSLPGVNDAFVNKNVLSEEIPDIDNKMVRFTRNVYYLKGELCHGIYHLDTFGVSGDKVTAQEASIDFKITKPYYFICGYMIKDHEDYQELSRKFKKRRTLESNEIMQLASKCAHPVYIPQFDMFMSHVKSSEPFSGVYTPLFSNFEFKINNGNTKYKSKCEFVSVNHGKIDEKKVNNNDADDLPWNNDEIDDNGKFQSDESTDDLVKKEINFELGSVLQSVQSAYNSISIYTDHKYGKKIERLLSEMETNLVNAEDIVC